MSTVKENLISARALIDTPEKFNYEGIVPALLAGGVTIARFNEMRSALLRETDGSTDRVVVWIRDKEHADIMALFDLAIAAQELTP